jgi:cell division protein FtsI/penicillin-binding protein 2
MRTRTKPLKLYRFMTFFILMVMAFAVLVGRFFQIQVLEGKEYSRKFKNQCWQNESIRAHRGTIYDRNGNPLAYTMESENIYACSDSIPILKDIALRAAPILDISQSRLYKKMTSNGGGRVSLAKSIDPVTSGKLRSMDIPGIEYEIEYDRVYPYGRSVAALIGYLNHEYQAKAGIEFYCDEFLSGRDGLRSYIKDASGNKYPILYEPDIPPVDGNDVYLTIDIEYQQILQEEIEKAVEKWHAAGGMGVLMEIASGKILAVYHYDPSQTDSNYKYPREKAITDLYEPGSTFKSIVFAALLEEGLIDLDDTIYAGEGKFKFNGITVHDDKKLEIITEAEAYVLSSNIATGRLALRLGPKKLFRYARDFGFGLSSGLDFPGEVNGRLNEPGVWSDYYCAMLSIGHEVSVSSVQMAGVFGCLANHGRLMKPFLLDRVISPTGGTIKRIYPEEIRSIFSDSTVVIMQRLCAQVVDTGTAKYAKLEGITFAGKTGTAEKPSPNGGYDKSKYIASFGGYFPRQNPQICGLIMIDEPKKIHYGGITAAPAFAMTAKRIINLQNRKKNFAGDVMYAPDGVFKVTDDVPDNKGYQDYSEEIDTQMMRAENVGITIDKTDAAENGDSALIFLPDLSGKSARSAVRALLSMGLECSLEGLGNVVRSVPEGGSFTRPGEHVKLICSLSEKEVGY